MGQPWVLHVCVSSSEQGAPPYWSALCSTCCRVCVGLVSSSAILQPVPYRCFLSQDLAQALHVLHDPWQGIAHGVSPQTWDSDWGGQAWPPYFTGVMMVRILLWVLVPKPLTKVSIHVPLHCPQARHEFTSQLIGQLWVLQSRSWVPEGQLLPPLVGSVLVRVRLILPPAPQVCSTPLFMQVLQLVHWPISQSAGQRWVLQD